MVAVPSPCPALLALAHSLQHLSAAQLSPQLSRASGARVNLDYPLSERPRPDIQQHPDDARGENSGGTGTRREGVCLCPCACRCVRFLNSPRAKHMASFPSSQHPAQGTAPNMLNRKVMKRPLVIEIPQRSLGTSGGSSHSAQSQLCPSWTREGSHRAHFQTFRHDLIGIS